MPPGEHLGQYTPIPVVRGFFGKKFGQKIYPILVQLFFENTMGNPFFTFKNIDQNSSKKNLEYHAGSSNQTVLGNPPLLGPSFRVRIAEISGPGKEVA